MWRLLTTTEVIAIHDAVLNPGELEGLAGSKSLEGALSRIDFRITYGVIQDVFDLAATYALSRLGRGTYSTTQTSALPICVCTPV